MKYQLSRNGKPVGIFSVEEIQRLQDTGQLNGSEFVWREGMANWEPAVSVLKTSAKKFVETEGGYSNRTRSIVLSLVTASVNGHEVFKDASPPEDAYVSTNRMYLGLGAFNDSNTTKIRYQNVQVRNLAAATDASDPTR